MHSNGDQVRRRHGQRRPAHPRDIVYPPGNHPTSNLSRRAGSAELEEEFDMSLGGLSDEGLQARRRSVEFGLDQNLSLLV